MSKVKKIEAITGGTSDELEAAFYEALQNADLERLMACWADDDEVVCVHPGGPRMVGLGAIRSAFEAMFNNGSIRVRPEAVLKVETLGSSVHSVRERIELVTPEGPMDAVVIATNVYHKTAQGWRLVAHHASPGTPNAPQEMSSSPSGLH